jgi:hypothetical protein
MMRIAILGATSQIARDLIVSFSAAEDKHLHLFARRPDEVTKWLASVGLSGRYPVDDFSEFSKQEFDAVINFVGVGNPAQAVAMGNSIFEVTLCYDELVLNYLKTHPACRYLFRLQRAGEPRYGCYRCNKQSGAARMVWRGKVTCGMPTSRTS